MSASRYSADSQAQGFIAKAEPGTPEYKHRVAEPTMRAVDSMPKEWREALHSYGYVGVFLAWRSRRWTIEQVRVKAEANGGVFEIE